VTVADPASFSLPYDHSLCTAIAALGHHLCLARCASTEGPWDQPTIYKQWLGFHRFTAFQPRLGAFRAVQRIARGGEHVLDLLNFARFVDDQSHGIVHFQWLNLPLLEGQFHRLLGHRFRLLLTLHNTSLFHNAPTSRVQGVGLVGAVRKFDAVIVHTEYSRARAVESGWVREDQVYVIPHGAFTYYTTLDQGLPATDSTGRLRLLFFGSLKRYKGLDVLIRSLALLPTAVRTVTTLIIAGQPGMDLRPLEDLARSLGVSSMIEWQARRITEGEVATLFRSATAVVLPYTEIDQSGVLLTAVAFGKPVVASNIGGIPEVITHGKNGYLVEPGDPDGLAEALTLLLDDQPRCEKMGGSMAALATGPLSWESIARQTVNLYHEVLERG